MAKTNKTVATTTVVGESTPKKANGGSRFTTTQNKAIAKSQIAASETPIAVVEQKGSDFFNSVTKLYNEKFKPRKRRERISESVKTLGKAIQKKSFLR